MEFPCPIFFFFDLPVYRLSSDIYSANQDKEIDAWISDARRGLPDYTPPETTIAWIKQHQLGKYGPWMFNEIIGYIRLHFLGSQIRGEYFSAEKKRNGLSRHKVFTYRTHKLAAEVSIWRGTDATNAEIFTSIQKYISDCKGELAKGRFIDDSIFMAIGLHMDWRGLLGWKPKGSSI